MRDLRAEDPAETVLAWEAVEELLGAVPDGAIKDVLRLVAAGLPAEEIAERLGVGVADVDTLAARGRIRLLTAAAADSQPDPAREVLDPEHQVLGHTPMTANRSEPMADNTYKVTEVVGTSEEGVAQAIRNGVHKAGETLRNLDWFEVIETRGHIEEGEVGHFQVTMKIGFRLD